MIHKVKKLKLNCLLLLTFLSGWRKYLDWTDLFSAKPRGCLCLLHDLFSDSFSICVDQIRAFYFDPSTHFAGTKMSNTIWWKVKTYTRWMIFVRKRRWLNFCIVLGKMHMLPHDNTWLLKYDKYKYQVTFVNTRNSCEQFSSDL